MKQSLKSMRKKLDSIIADSSLDHHVMLAQMNNDSKDISELDNVGLYAFTPSLFCVGELGTTSDRSSACMPSRCGCQKEEELDESEVSNDAPPTYGLKSQPFFGITANPF